jgi:pimeloyl-ACP methyl ester carboxylesterase
MANALGVSLGARRVWQRGSEPSVQWDSVTFDEQEVRYLRAGSGNTLLFLHGWGLGPLAYRKPIEALAELGLEVIAPCLPAFAGTRELKGVDMSFQGYSAWVKRFLDASRPGEHPVVVGHSFGGGVAVAFCADHLQSVTGLVLANSVGSPTWTGGSHAQSMDQRPLWDWGIELGVDLLQIPQLFRILPAVLEDAVPNLFGNPVGLWRVANLIRGANLTSDLVWIKSARLPVAVVWSDRDRLVPGASFDAMCEALGVKGRIVEGNHAWLMADPTVLAHLVANVVTEAAFATS